MLNSVTVWPYWLYSRAWTPNPWGYEFQIEGFMDIVTMLSFLFSDHIKVEFSCKNTCSLHVHIGPTRRHKPPDPGAMDFTFFRRGFHGHHNYTLRFSHIRGSTDLNSKWFLKMFTFLIFSPTHEAPGW